MLYMITKLIIDHILDGVENFHQLPANHKKELIIEIIERLIVDDIHWAREILLDDIDDKKFMELFLQEIKQSNPNNLAHFFLETALYHLEDSINEQFENLIPDAEESRHEWMLDSNAETINELNRNIA